MHHAPCGPTSRRAKPGVFPLCTLAQAKHPTCRGNTTSVLGNSAESGEEPTGGWSNSWHDGSGSNALKTAHAQGFGAPATRSLQHAVTADWSPSAMRLPTHVRGRAPQAEEEGAIRRVGAHATDVHVRGASAEADLRPRGEGTTLPSSNSPSRVEPPHHRRTAPPLVAFAVYP